MRLIIDLQGAQNTSRWRGIGRYCLALAQSIARHRRAHEVIIVLNGAFPETIRPIRNAFKSLLPRENIRVWSAPGPVRASDPSNTERRYRAEAVYEAFLASLEPDIIHVCSLFEGFGDDTVTTVRAIDFGIPTSVTFYDLIPLHDPERYLRPNPAWDALYTEKLLALSRADLLLAISEFSAHDATRYLDNEGQKLVNISAACSDIFKPSEMSQYARTGLLKRLALDRPYILTSGTIDPHKNLITLMRAFVRMPNAVRKAHKLAIIGRVEGANRVVLDKMAREAGLVEGELVITGYVQDDELVALYSDAKLMVFPSTDEGFGLPALEAMSCGAPTLGSRAASIPEVIDLDEAMFDPMDVNALSLLMVRSIEDAAFRKRLLEHAKIQAGKFSWDETGKRALAAMENLLEGKSAMAVRGDYILDRCLQKIEETLPGPDELRELSQELANSFPDTNQPRQLFIDISTLRENDARTGIQRVTRSILQELLKTSPEGLSVEPIYATPTEQGYRYARAYIAQLTGDSLSGGDEIIDFQQGDIFFGLDLPLHILPFQRPWLKNMQKHGVDIRFIVYDLLPIQFPHFFADIIPPLYKEWLETISSFDGIIGISRDVSDAFQAWRSQQSIEGDTDFRFDAVHLGADIENSLPTKGLPDNASSVLSAIKQDPSFLMVGTLEPRKGYEQALSALEILWARGVRVNLVIVGKEGWKTGRLIANFRNHPENGRRLFWLEGVSDEYLQATYAAASCLLAASEAEGFGLPLIEAAQANIPILARDIPVFREVASDNASYFRGEAPEALAKSIEQWLERDSKGLTISSEGLRWLTWAESAARMAEILLTPYYQTDKPDATDVSVGRKKAI